MSLNERWAVAKAWLDVALKAIDSHDREHLVYCLDQAKAALFAGGGGDW